LITYTICDFKSAITYYYYLKECLEIKKSIFTAFYNPTNLANCQNYLEKTSSFCVQLVNCVRAIFELGNFIYICINSQSSADLFLILRSHSTFSFNTPLLIHLFQPNYAFMLNFCHLCV